MKRFIGSKLVLSLAAIALPLSGSIMHTHAQSAPTISLHPTSGPPGTVITVTGSGWTPGKLIDIRFGTSGPSAATLTVASDGTFITILTVPTNEPLGPLTISGDQAGVTALATFTVTKSTGGTTVITKDSCSSKIPISGTISSPATVKVDINLSTTDSHKNEQNEPLKITDTATNKAEVIAILNGQSSIARTFTFVVTAEEGDKLFACINGEGGRADETATINVTVTRTPTQEEQQFETLIIGCVVPFLKLGTAIGFVHLVSEGKIGEAFKSLIPFIGIPGQAKACQSLLCFTGVIGQFGLIQVGNCKEQEAELGIAR